MRSTTRQRLGQIDRPQSVSQDWSKRLLLGLRVVLAACTAVVTLGVLTQEPAGPDLRWLLAFLASSLFLLTIMEPRVFRRLEPGVTDYLNGEIVVDGLTRKETSGQVVSADRGTGSPEGTQMKLRQLAVHHADYVSTVSHELRTPLTSIQGFAQLLTREESPTGKSAEYARTILSEAERLARIVDDVIVLTKMESSLLDLKCAPVVVTDVIANVVERLSPLQGPGNLAVNMPGQLPAVHGDHARLEQLLESIVLDSISRANQESVITLVAEEAGAAVRIGLAYQASPAQIARVRRALGGLWDCGSDGMATRLGRGDLGIYVARNLVEAQGGSISLESPEDGEVRVSITLPC